MTVPACCLAMTLSPSFVSHNQAVWARAAGTDWVKSSVDVTSCTIHVQTNYSYSFWWHYSSKYEYTIRTTIRHRSEYSVHPVVKYLCCNVWTGTWQKLVGCCKWHQQVYTTVCICRAIMWITLDNLFSSSSLKPKYATRTIIVANNKNNLPVFTCL